MAWNTGDFLGFKFGDKHSSSFNIVRISGGSRFNKDLLPSATDSTITVPGRHGALYFGRTYQPRSIEVQFAYDGLSEGNIREIRNWLGSLELKSLVFDEEPYKEYSAIISSNQPKLSFICFDEGGKRVYKGEGNVTFQLYDIYARAPKRTLNEYTDSNREEWSLASGLLEALGTYDNFTGATCKLFNPGDVDSPIKLAFKPTGTEPLSGEVSLTHKINGDYNESLILDLQYFSPNTTYVIDGEVGLIYEEGSDEVLNHAIIAGDFLVVKMGPDTLSQTLEFDGNITIEKRNGRDVEYDYLYF